jgi:hypothetical protein
MGKLLVKYYLNTETGMLYKTADSTHKNGVVIIGKRVKVEQLEYDWLKIDGKYFRIESWEDGLVKVIPSEKHTLTVTVTFTGPLSEDCKQNIEANIERGIDKVGYCVDNMDWKVVEE